MLGEVRQVADRNTQAAKNTRGATANLEANARALGEAMDELAEGA
jgi:methyl-accepting chemotaxis protein